MAQYVKPQLETAPSIGVGDVRLSPASKSNLTKARGTQQMKDQVFGTFPLLGEVRMESLAPGFGWPGPGV